MFFSDNGLWMSHFRPRWTRCGRCWSYTAVVLTASRLAVSCDAPLVPITLLIGFSARRQELQDVFTSPPLISRWGWPSVFPSPTEAVRHRFTSVGGNNLCAVFLGAQLVSVSLSFTVTHAARAHSHGVMEGTSGASFSDQRNRENKCLHFYNNVACFFAFLL